MKNAINYYYNLVTYDIRHKGKKYRFTVESDEYLLVNCEYNLEELDSKYDGYVTVNFGSLVKSGNEWSFTANGEPSNANSIGSFVDTYK